MKPENGAKCHDLLVREATPALAFSPRADFEKWQGKLRAAFLSLTGLDRMPERPRAPQFEIEGEENKDGYREIRFAFESEPHVTVPCYLLIPDTGKKKYPVVITMQGHSTGFHNSVGQVIYEEDKTYQPRGQFAIQAVREGYIALAIEQRGMGCRAAENTDFREVHPGRDRAGCHYEAMTALLLGRTLIGERCFDISCAIDQLARFPECDLGKIAITGNSGGGTISYYAAAYDSRIGLSVPSCAFCTYGESIARKYHCTCNYIPRALEYFDMQDIAGLIAPRPLSCINGILDEIFLVNGVMRGFETVKAIYKKAGAPENCNLILTECGHWWCVDTVWQEVRRQMTALGWLV